MIIQVVLTVLVIALVVGTLAYFLGVIARVLNSISATCGKITFGVRAVETQCAVIGPAVSRINGGLQELVARLDRAAAEAEQLAR